MKVTAIVATIGVVVALVGLLSLLRPVSTPTQDCGTVAGFLLDGRSNVYIDPNDLPKGVTAAEAKANNAHPCRERVADQTKPGAVVLLGGLTVAVGAALVEMTARGLAWRRRRRARPRR